MFKAGKIDKNGRLYIERRGILHAQYCPYGPQSACGEWCSKFGKPQRDHRGFDGKYMTELDICGDQVLRFGKFTIEGDFND